MLRIVPAHEGRRPSSLARAGMRRTLTAAGTRGRSCGRDGQSREAILSQACTMAAAGSDGKTRSSSRLRRQVVAKAKPPNRDGESQDVRTTTGEGDDTRATTGISRKSVVQGKPDVRPTPVVTEACVLFLPIGTQGHRMRPASGFPCALIYLRREIASKPRANHAARTMSHILSPHAEERCATTSRHLRTVVARLEGRGPGFQSAGASWFETAFGLLTMRVERCARVTAAV